MNVHEGTLETYEPDELRFTPLPHKDVPVIAAALERGVGKAFAAANAAGQQARSNLFGLSMSYLGGCRRQSAYRVAGSDPDPQYVKVMDQDEARAAMLGVWLHEGLLPHLAELLAGGEREMSVELVAPVGEEENGIVPLVKVAGSADCYTRAAGGGVVDLKTVGAFKLADIDAFGPRPRHRDQVRGYAAAVVQMGLPVAWTAWAYLDRGDGSVRVVVEPFGREEYVGVLRQVRYLVGFAKDPESAPRDERGPQLSWVCDTCPFLRRCWGPDAEPGDKSGIAVHDDQEIAFAGEQVVELRAQRTALDKRIDFYKAQVGRPDAGRYGGVTVSYGRNGLKADAPKMEERLRELGEPIPMVPTAGNTYIRRAPKTKETKG